MGGVEPHMAICPGSSPDGHARDERVGDELGCHSPVGTVWLTDHECDEARGEPCHVTERQHLARGEVDRHGWKPLAGIGTPITRKRTELAKEEPWAKGASTGVGECCVGRRLSRPFAHRTMLLQFACPRASRTCACEPRRKVRT